MIRRWRRAPEEATVRGHVIPASEAARLSGAGQ